MKNFSVRKLKWLVGICLLGINAFQGYWLWSEYQARQRRFAADVNSALIHATQEVRLGTAAHLLPVLDSLRQTPASVMREMRVSLKIPTDTVVIAFRPEWLQKTASWKQHFHAVDSVFHQELLQRGILASYRLDTCHEKHSLHIFQSARQREKGTRTEARTESEVLVMAESAETADTSGFIEVKAPLDMSAGLWVCASFHRHNAHIIYSIAGMVAVSLLLMLLTAGAFFYLLYIIQRQKKLAELKRDFINAVTHELQTPVATASAAIEALSHFNALDHPERAHTYLEIADAQLKQLSDMVDQTLHLAAEERDHFPLHVHPVHLPSLIQPLLDNAVLAAGRPVSVTFDNQAGETIYADPVQLSRAVKNLTDNAIKYVSAAVTPAIEVRTRLAGNDKWELCIRDNGPGIPEVYHPQLFERFFRVPSDHNVKGFGLGLYVAQRIAHEHGGHLRLEQSDSRGSLFVLSLPLHPAVSA